MSPIQLIKGSSLRVSGDQTEGMVRLAAFANVSDQICGNCKASFKKKKLLDHCYANVFPLMIAKPHTTSAVHHHGQEDTIVYAAKGRGSIVSEGGSRRDDLEPGDWALIPAYAEHQEVNESDEDIVWVIVRGGRIPIVENLESWGASTKS